jgi:hypothetical protein
MFVKKKKRELKSEMEINTKLLKIYSNYGSEIFRA